MQNKNSYSYISEVDALLEITKIEWKVRHIPEDRQKLKLFNRIGRGSNNARVKMVNRMWDLYELSTLRSTSSDIWVVKTTNSLERPRYIIIGFQNTDRNVDRTKDVTKFTHVDISNIRVYLYLEVLTYE